MLLARGLCPAATITVDRNGGGDYTEIQPAIDAAADGDTVLVQPGEYVISKPLDFNRAHDPEDPGSPPVKDITLRSAEGAEVTTIRMADEEPVVIFEHGETASSSLEGFTLTDAGAGGCDDDPYCYRTTAVVYCGEGSSPVLRDCTISDSGRYNNAGVFCGKSSSASFIDCRIERNGPWGGGGVKCGGSTATFTRCTISGNVAMNFMDFYGGGGIECIGGAPAFLDCTIAGNSAYNGGGISCLDSSPSFTRCAITGNLAHDSWGGALWIGGKSSPVFTRCTIAKNYGAGADITDGATPVFRSCILWGNTGGSLVVSAGSWGDNPAEPEVTYSCLEGEEVWPGEGNINTDPLFCGWESSDVYVDHSRPGPGEGTEISPYAEIAWAFDFRFSLAAGSPCRGSGEGGENMGADLGTCEAPGPAIRRIHIAEGIYQADVPTVCYWDEDSDTKNNPPPVRGSMNYLSDVELLGAGASATALEGTLRCGGHAVLSDLRVEGTLEFDSAHATLARSIVTNGVWCHDGTDGEITGCLLLLLDINWCNECNVDGGYYSYFSPLCVRDGSIRIRASTVAGNLYDPGIVVGENGTVDVSDSIIWGNVYGGIVRKGNGAATVRSSCTQDPEEGEGNFTADPLFCGTGGLPEVAVGSQEELNAALAVTIEGFSYALRANSPCLGAGETGGRVGADLGTCPADEPPRRMVQLAPGTYWVGDLSTVKLAGAGPGQTFLGKRNIRLHDSILSDLTVTGVLVLYGSSELEQVTVEGRVDLGTGSFVIADSFILGRGLTAVSGWGESTALVIHGSTIVGGEYGIGLGEDASAEVTNSIVWRNLLGGILLRFGAEAIVRYSCIQGDELWPGEGNLNVDPRFCGWSGPVDTLVTTAEGLSQALDDSFDYALAADSPCLGAGLDGARMGADTGLCAEGRPERRIRLAAGIYEVVAESTFGIKLEPGITLRGASREETIIASREKLSMLLRGGALEDLTVEGGIRMEGNATIARGIVRYSPGSGIGCGLGRPRIEDCLITASKYAGIVCEQSTAPDIHHCTITFNGNWGISLGDGAQPSIADSIVWGNFSGPLSPNENASPEISFSCLDSAEVWPGVGNINTDPLFCGWPGGANPVLVKNDDELKAALTFRHALAPGSPCRDTDSSGTDMGAVLGRCEAAGSPPQSILLGAGTYDADRIGSVSPMALDIQGAGADLTVLEGRLGLLRSRMSLSRVSQLTILGKLIVSGDDTPEIHQVTIRQSEGTGVSCQDNSAPIFRDCTIFDHGGVGVHCDKDSNPTFLGCEITGNLDGGIHLEAKAALFEDCRITGNRGLYRGGGVRVRVRYRTTARFNRCTISGNGAPEGGGIHLDGYRSSPVLTDCTISGNWAERDGGGVYCDINSSPILRNCTISGNFAFGSNNKGGGGILCYQDSSPLLIDCTISGNWVQNYTGGGGISAYAYASPTLINCVIAGNHVQEGGSGVFSQYHSAPELINCTISGNFATQAESGVIYCTEDSGATLTNCIIWGNSSPPVGGNLSYCLTDEDPLFVTSGQFDFDRRKTVTIGGESYLLPDFIVEAPDLRLRAGSPAIDAGWRKGAPTSDRDGFVRPCGDGVDIGAYEYGGCPDDRVRFLRGDANGDGRLDLSDVIKFLTHQFLGGETLDCLDAADVDDNGRLELTDAVKSLYYQFTGTVSEPEPPGPFDCGPDPTMDTLTCDSYQCPADAK